MRGLALTSILALCVALAAPAGAQKAYWGTSLVSPGIRADLRPGPPRRSAREMPDRQPYFGSRPPRPHPPPRPGWPRPRPPPPFYYYYHRHHDHDDREGADDVPPGQQQPAPPHPIELPPVEREPPDPRGESRFLRARGAAEAEPVYMLGEQLPPGLPYVTLNWASYGFPEPPPGRIYVRVRREVLLIEPASRVVEARIEVERGTPDER